MQQFHACNITDQGPQNLCWHEAGALARDRKAQNESDATDYHRIFDSTYTEVGQALWTVGNLTALDLGRKTVSAQPDAHEFTVVGNGSSYVQLTYFRMPMDLREWLGPEDGYIMENCFQEVRFSPSEVLFQWCYNDHLHMESHVLPSGPDQTGFSTGMGGDGSWYGAWDFYHLNSVDKNGEGDYLVSGRHADQIMKIAGPASPNGVPGTVLWKLGGVSNQFQKEDDFIFTRQHDARFVSTSADETVFSIFDNAWEGEQDINETSQPYSSGKLISINNATMQARVVQEYPHPDNSLCRSGGSARALPNGNMWVGWGFIREVSEFQADGTLLYHAAMACTGGDASSSYRDFKFPWHAEPKSSPKLTAYLQHCAASSIAPLVAYVSWNGATEVARWRFSLSDAQDGPWTEISTAERSTFETRAHLLNEFFAWVRVEALDSGEEVLGSQIARTFVPSEQALQGCDMYGCSDGAFTAYADTFNVAHLCQSRHEPISYHTESNQTSGVAEVEPEGTVDYSPSEINDTHASSIADHTLTDEDHFAVSPIDSLDSTGRDGATTSGTTHPTSVADKTDGDHFAVSHVASFHGTGGDGVPTTRTCQYYFCHGPTFLVLFTAVSLGVTFKIVQRWHSLRSRIRSPKRSLLSAD